MSRWLSALLAVVVGLLPGCAPLRGVADPERTAWHHPPQPARGTAVLVHGLNNPPELMEYLHPLLDAEGFSALTVKLAGHAAPEDPPPSSGTVWIDNIRAAVREAEAANPAGPVIIIGYSVGATAAILLAAAEDAPRIDGLILLAPALALRPVAQLGRLLLPLQRFGLSLPSLAPRATRLRDTTPLRSYAALFELADRAAVADLRGLASIPTLAVVARDDEYVSSARALRWFAEHYPPGYETIIAAGDYEPKHLLFDPEQQRIRPALEEPVRRFLRKRLPRG